MRRHLAMGFLSTLVTLGVTEVDRGTAQEALPSLPAARAAAVIDEVEAIAEIRQRLGGGLAVELQGLLPGVDGEAMFRQELELLAEPRVSQDLPEAAHDAGPEAADRPVATWVMQGVSHSRPVPGPPRLPALRLPAMPAAAARWMAAAPQPSAHAPQQAGRDALRRAAQELERLAADLERASLYPQADHLRHQAMDFWHQAREMGGPHPPHSPGPDAHPSHPPGPAAHPPHAPGPGGQLRQMVPEGFRGNRRPPEPPDLSAGRRQDGPHRPQRANDRAPRGDQPRPEEANRLRDGDRPGDRDRPRGDDRPREGARDGDRPRSGDRPREDERSRDRRPDAPATDSRGNRQKIEIELEVERPSADGRGRAPDRKD